MKSFYTGVNIQFPISDLILLKKKKIETRTYALPKRYIGTPLIFIETPGKTGNFNARIRGLVIFGPPFKYKNKTQFYDDFASHLVDESSPWKWTVKGKWGWPILKLKVFTTSLPAPKKKGIVFTKNISIAHNDG